MRPHLLLALASLAFGQQAQQQFIHDNLAPYLPSPQIVVEKMLESAQLKPGEMLFDLGCGDGRIVITAAQKYHARAVGIEIQESLVRSTNQRIAELGLEPLVKVVHASALSYDLSPADVVTLYLLTSSNERLRPQLEKHLKPGARVVSYAFEIPGWKPLRVESFQVDRLKHTIYVYEIQPPKGAKPKK